MSVPEFTVSDTLPTEYVAIPLSADQLSAPLRICAVVRKEPDVVAGQLVLLRDMLDARVLLGCVIDAGYVVKRWVELWVQDLAHFVEATQSSSISRALSNTVVDERWEQQFSFLRSTCPESVIQTGWESQNPYPTWLDVGTAEPIHLAEETSGAAWVLCRDDAILGSRGLPSYSTTMHRYLYVGERGVDSQFVPITPDAPENETTVPLETLLPRGNNWVPFNPGGGLVMVRSFGPLKLEELFELLGGGTWTGVNHGKSRLDIGSVPANGNGNGDGRDNLSMGGWFFLNPSGKAGRFTEVFHLKVKLFSEIVDGVREQVQRTQRPLLNLCPDSFEVNSDHVGRGLPVLWSCRSRLIDPGNAISLKVPAGETKYYLPGREGGMGVYLPRAVGSGTRGVGQFQILRVQSSVGGMTTLEGSLDTRDELVADRNDLLQLRVTFGGERVDLYAKLQPQKSLARGQIKFLTVPLRFSDRANESLRQAEGVPLPQIPFEIIKLLSTPCDLYSLGVLAVRLFFVNPKTTLPEALNAMLALAKESGRQHDAVTPIRARIAKLFESDPRFLELLGPDRLWKTDITPAEGFGYLPAELWMDLTAAIVATFPGYGPDSRCNDLGDAPPNGVHLIFNKLAESMDSLLVRSRSLMLVDWRYNREINSVIRSARKARV